VETRRLVIPGHWSRETIAQQVSPAGACIRSGGLVVFPTETVYGLGAGIHDPNAVRSIFAAKGRPADNPLIVHVASVEVLHDLVDSQELSRWKDVITRFWPGPVTFLLRKTAAVPGCVTAHMDTVGVRMPAHPVSQLFLESCGIPVAAPSANRSGFPSPTRSSHLEEMEGKVDWILDAGELPLGLESTIISLSHTPPLLLRPGPLSVEELQKWIPGIVFAQGSSHQPLAPGMKYRHYAPRAQLVLCPYDEDLSRLQQRALLLFRQYSTRGKKVWILSTEETRGVYDQEKIANSSMGTRQDLYSVAKNLFDSFRLLDRLGMDVGIVEGFPPRGLGFAIMNRILKATGENPWD